MNNDLAPDACRIPHDARRRLGFPGSSPGGIRVTAPSARSPCRNLTPVARAEVARLLHAHPAILGANPLNAEYGWACTYPDHPASGGPGRRSPEHFVNYRAHADGRHRGFGLRRGAAMRGLGDRRRLRDPALADRERPGKGRGPGLSRPLARRHPPAAAQLLSRRSGRQRGRIRAACAPTTSIRPGTPAYCRAAPSPAAGRSRTFARWRRPGAARSATSSAPSGSRPSPGNGRRNPTRSRSGRRSAIASWSRARANIPRLRWRWRRPRRGVRIDAAYMDGAMPIIQRRITQAGVRLAHLINLALDPAYRR